VRQHFTTWPVQALLLSSTLGLVACGGTDEEPGEKTVSSYGYCREKTPALVSGSGVPRNPATPLAETTIQGSACNAVERQFYVDSAAHTDICSDIAYTTNPPCFGPHYGIAWAAFRMYDEPVPRGFWVHSLEHGAVALLYSCTDCDDEVRAAENLIADIGIDPLCIPQSVSTERVVLTPDPRLETRWAAASWGFTLTADCFEPDVFRDFVVTHRGNGIEPYCSPPPLDPGVKPAP
jgi:hypothetical protein